MRYARKGAVSLTFNVFRPRIPDGYTSGPPKPRISLRGRLVGGEFGLLWWPLDVPSRFVGCGVTDVQPLSFRARAEVKDTGIAAVRAGGQRRSIGGAFSHPGPAPQGDYADGEAEQHLGREEVDDYPRGVDENQAAAARQGRGVHQREDAQRDVAGREQRVGRGDSNDDAVDHRVHQHGADAGDGGRYQKAAPRPDAVACVEQRAADAHGDQHGEVYERLGDVGRALRERLHLIGRIKHAQAEHYVRDKDQHERRDQRRYDVHEHDAEDFV